MSKPKGHIIYRGPSTFNTKPIVAVVVWKSSNVKTGDMPQLYILPEPTVYGMPTEASKSYADEAVCGDCPLRRVWGGACYVVLHQGPRAVADGVLRGIYPNATRDDMERVNASNLRRGAYGDPAALPKTVLAWTSQRNGTGYTHQWANRRFGHLASQVMASVDDKVDYIRAKQLGFRTFRMLRVGESLMNNEIMCPAVDKGATCKECGLCDGKRGPDDKRKDIVVPVHGALKGRF